MPLYGHLSTCYRTREDAINGFAVHVTVQLLLTIVPGAAAMSKRARACSGAEHETAPVKIHKQEQNDADVPGKCS